MSHRGLVLFGVSFAIFCASLLLVETTCVRNSMPEQDQSLFLLMTIKTPVGTSMTATNEAFTSRRRTTSKQPEVTEYYTTIGNYENNNVVNAGVIYVDLKGCQKRKLTPA